MRQWPKTRIEENYHPLKQASQPLFSTASTHLGHEKVEAAVTPSMPRPLEALGASERPGNVSGMLIDIARYLA